MRRLIAVLIVLAVAPVVEAAPVTWYFSGKIDSVTDYTGFFAENDVNAETPFTGSFTFESTAPDAYPDDPTFGGYSAPSPALHVVMGQLNITGGGGEGVTIDNRTTYDRITMWSADFESSGMLVQGMGLDLRDSTASLLSDDHLLLHPPSLQSVTTAGFGMEGTLRTPYGPVYLGFSGSLETLTPEPASLILVGAAAGLFWRRRRA